MQLKTAGDLRGFLADVLVGIKSGSVDASQASSISKVAAQINASIATEVQARIHLKELGGDAAGAMIIANPVADTRPAPELTHHHVDDDHVPDAGKMVEIEAEAPAQPEPKIEPICQPEQIAESANSPVVALATSLDEAAANYRRNTQDKDKTWCDQCEMRVTTSQAVSCKSRYCKAKEAA